MIIGIGADIVKTHRIAELIEKFGDKFLHRIFCDSEISQAQKMKNDELKIRFFAKRFAAKEAFSKAIGTGFGRGLDFVDVEIRNDDLGKPFLQISPTKIEFLQEKFSCEINELNFQLSISDEDGLALAFVVIEKI